MGLTSSGNSTCQKSKFPEPCGGSDGQAPRGITIKLLSFPGLLTSRPKFTGSPHVPSFCNLDMNTSS